MMMTEQPSPNHGPRQAGPVDMVVLHYTGMKTGGEALERLCDPAAGVSAHYLIEEDGRLFRLVPEARRAWHAGASFWAGERDINSRSIGIELVNPGHEFGYRPFPEAQIEALLALLADLASRYRIAPLNWLGHSDVAPARKTDPGEFFPWKRMSEAGFGLWPECEPDEGRVSMPALAPALTRIGYDPADPQAALSAFRRRFEPDQRARPPGPATLARANWLAAHRKH